MKLHFRIAALGAVAVLLFAACGGGSSSSGRQRNVALCYADQAEKNAAVSEAQAAFDASFGGNPPPSDSVAPSDSSVPDSSVPDTSVPAEETPDTLSSDGGGYRRPAVRHFATVPPSEPADSVALTDEQLALQLELQAAEDKQLCESSDASADPVQVTCTATVTVEGVTDNCDPGDVLISDQGVWVLNDVNDAELARGEVDISALSADNPIVIEISYQIAGQESSDTTTPSETQTINCTGTVSGTFDNPGGSSDCPNPFGISVRSSDGNSVHWGVYDDGGVEIAGGEVDISALSEENPIFVQISYEIAAQESSDTTVPGNEDCTFTLAQNGIEWVCNAPINISFSANGGGIANSIECSTQSEDKSNQYGYPTWEDYSFVVSINGETIASIAYEGDAVMQVDLPDDVVNLSCPKKPGDYSNLEFSRDFTGYSRQYNFTLSEKQNVVITANSFQDNCDAPQNNPRLWVFRGSAPWSVNNENRLDYSDNDLASEGNCSAAFFDGELDAGNYYIWVENAAYDGNDEGNAVVTVNSSVELFPYVYTQTPLPATQYSTSFSTSDRSYQFTLAETTEVTFTASSNQSCSPDDLWTNNDGFVTPGSDLYTQEAWNNDDDAIIASTLMYGSPTNCAVNIIQQTLEAGDYVFHAYADDDDLGTITIGSSIPLVVPKDVSFKSMTTVQVDAVQSFDVIVPAGGLWFRAEGNSWNSVDCSIDCVDPVLILVDENNETVSLSDDDGETSDNSYASLIERFLPEGNYRLIATTYPIWDEVCNNCPTKYELKYGFATKSAAPAPEVVLEPSSNNEMPPNLPAPASLPISGLKSDGSSTSSAAIAEGVNTMVCNSTCIDTLFTNAGITDGTIDITAGGRTVTVKKGQKKAVIPVGARAKEITAVAKSADGTQQVELTDGLNIIPSDVQQALDSKTTTGVVNTSSGSSSKLPYLLALLVVLLGAAAVVNARRKKSVTQN